MGANTPEWFMSSVGSILAGGLSTGIYATNSPEMVSYICGHAPLQILVIQDMELLGKVSGGRNLRATFPTLKAIVLVEGKAQGDAWLEAWNLSYLVQYWLTLYADVFSWQQLIDLGHSQSEQLLVDSEKAQSANECAMMIYTSGTTGPPKGKWDIKLKESNITKLRC